MVPLRLYTKDQQDIIMQLASMDLIELSFNAKGVMCAYMSDDQIDTVEALGDLDDEYFIKLFNINP